MKQEYKGLCVSSSSGGGGKTLLSIGLGRALTRKNWRVKAFKKGPDYIDAAWLSAACNIPATNLDPFFLKREQIKDLFRKSLGRENEGRKEGLFALLEGNRGLFDGLDELGTYSTAQICRTLNLPILLNINCEKATRTIAAIIQGITRFEKGLNFIGVVLNRVGSERHAKALRQSIERETNLKIYGALPRLERNLVPERHMGLASRGEDLAENAEQTIESLADWITVNCDIDSLLSNLPLQNLCRISDSLISTNQINISNKQTNCNNCNKPKIGYVLDKAFWFYYPENLQALREEGAELVKLKIIGATKEDLAQWENLDGLYIGGGFPEDFAVELASSSLLGKIKDYVENGMPIYAECGGMILLCKSLFINDKYYKMAGVFTNDIIWSKKPQGLGYIKGKIISKNPFFPIGLTVLGHEFHYSSSKPVDFKQNFALTLDYGYGLSNKQDALLYKNVWASYAHIFAPALPCWAKNFVRASIKWKMELK